MLAAVLTLLGGPGATALDTLIYDRWLRGRVAVRETPGVVIVTRDPASVTRFGAGAWDRAVLARAITALGHAGARGIGLDVTIDQSSVPGRGGPSSDALLAQAVQDANVVMLASGAAGSLRRPGGLRLGHALTEADPDGIVRRVPLHVALDGQPIPALALVLAGPPNRAAGDSALVAFAGAGLPRGVRVVPFSEVWTAIERGAPQNLPPLIDDRLVLLLVEPPRPSVPTPVAASIPCSSKPTCCARCSPATPRVKPRRHG